MLHVDYLQLLLLWEGDGEEVTLQHALGRWLLCWQCNMSFCVMRRSSEVATTGLQYTCSMKPEPDLPPEFDPRNDVQGVGLLIVIWHCTMID